MSNANDTDMSPVPAEQTARERAADRERLVDIAARLVELGRSPSAEKKLLQTEQDSLQDRLSACIYPVLTLPPEIVSEIFVHFLPVYPRRAPRRGRYSPIIFTHICRLWREIALSTPRLWRAFKISIYPYDSRLNKQGRVEEWLQRSGSCPLSVNVHLDNLCPDPAPPILQTLVAHRNRWEHLKLRLNTDDLSVIVGPFPLLHTLTVIAYLLDARDMTHQSTAFRDAPLLHRVALDKYKEVFRDMLPWSQLTVLVIQSIEETQCLEILALAPCLVYCDLGVGQDGESDAPRHVLLDQLKTLKLRYESVSYPLYPTILNLQLQVPALRRLYIYEAHLTPDWARPDPVVTLRTLRTLLMRWNCTPQEIRIAFPELGIDYSKALPSTMISFSQRHPPSIHWVLTRRTSGSPASEAANIDEDVWTSDSENAGASDSEKEQVEEDSSEEEEEEEE